MAMSEETHAARAVVDAMRQMMGMDPLYNQDKRRRCQWMDDVRDAYFDTRQRRTPTRGAKK